MATALDADLKYWEEPQRVFRTPTEGHDSPQVGPPGLPTPKAGPTSQQDFMQQGGALSSRQAARGTEHQRMVSERRGEQDAGRCRQEQRDDANLGERNLFEGRTGVRAENNAQGQSQISTNRVEVEDHLAVLERWVQ